MSRPTDLISIAEAMQLADRKAVTTRRWCNGLRGHREVAEDPGSRLLVSRSELLLYLKSVDSKADGSHGENTNPAASRDPKLARLRAGLDDVLEKLKLMEVQVVAAPLGREEPDRPVFFDECEKAMAHLRVAQTGLSMARAYLATCRLGSGTSGDFGGSSGFEYTLGLGSGSGDCEAEERRVAFWEGKVADAEAEVGRECGLV